MIPDRRLRPSDRRWCAHTAVAIEMISMEKAQVKKDRKKHTHTHKHTAHTLIHKTYACTHMSHADHTHAQTHHTEPIQVPGERASASIDGRQHRK